MDVENDSSAFFLYNDGFSPSVAALLEAMQAKDAVPAFKAHNIGIKDFSALSDIDLIILGVDDEITRRNIVEHSKHLPPNTQSVDTQNVPDLTLADIINIIGDSEKHLNRICVNFKMDRLLLEKSKSEDKIVYFPKTYATSVVLESFNHIRNLLREMKLDIYSLDEISIPAQIKKKNRRKKRLVLMSGFAIIVLSICFHKSLKLLH